MNLFEDPDNNSINLPISIKNDTVGEIKWLRPEDYIRQYNIEKELKIREPNKNPIKLRHKLNDLYKLPKPTQEERQILANYMDHPPTSKKSQMSFKPEKQTFINIYNEQKQFLNEYYNFYEIPLNLKLFSSSERMETDEEFQLRKEELEKNLKSNAKKANQMNQKLDNYSIHKIPIHDISPCNITMFEKYNKFSKWVASQLQAVKDLNLKDIDSDNSVFYNIYPQRDGLPIYNPSGRYWIKLFHMGKWRKIEIDDRMPCSKYEQFILPKCTSLDEIWPAILTKALLKLFSYKYKMNAYYYEEIGDCSIINALTGFIGEKYELNMSTHSVAFKKLSCLNVLAPIQCLQIIERNLDDEIYSRNHKFILGFNSTNTELLSHCNKSMDINLESVVSVPTLKILKKSFTIIDSSSIDKKKNKTTGFQKHSMRRNTCNYYF